MRKIIIILIFAGFSFSLFAGPGFCSSTTADYLCETGISFYRSGRYDDALMEFKKALMVDPGNQTAKTYINNIFKQNMTLPVVLPQEVTAKPKVSVTAPPAASKEIPIVLAQEKPIPKAEVVEESIEEPSREEIMNEALQGLSKKEEIKEEAKEERKEEVWVEPKVEPKIEEPKAEPKVEIKAEPKVEIKAEPKIEPKIEVPKAEPEIERPAKEEKEALKITGETQVRLGVTTQDTYWKRANWDLNEKNFRTTSNTALDRRENTFDPRIYDRLRVNLDTNNAEGLGFHSDITVDPWSFTGKSSKITTAASNFGDTADIELKYWSNTGYTINETVNTNLLGNSFSLPEIKVESGKTKAFDINGAFDPKDTFNIPEMKIERQFQPIRELRFDYKRDDLNLNLFPIAYEDQALTFDDPLRLSNNRIWWENSPWLNGWTRGNFNSDPAANDFNKGFWDNTLSFFTRDSEGQRLTSLRGFSFQFSPREETSIQTSFASPKTLWQDYSTADNFLTATRVKQSVSDNLNLGLTATTRHGYNTEARGNWKIDSSNYVVATDMGYEITEGIKSSFEVARSASGYDLTNLQFKSDAVGSAYHFSLLGRFPAKSILNSEYGYYGIKPEEGERFFTKFRFFFVRMDESFDEPLSSYVETRDDEFWSRHLHFRQPFKYYYQGRGQLLSWEDVKNFRIGDGIDIGRSTIGLRVESLLWDKKVDNLLDVRNVHGSNSGKFIENVTREEITWEMNDRLTSKMLGIYHRLHDTLGGIDPFVFNSRTRRFFTNNQIEDGKNVSIATGSLGAEYEFFDWLALSGIWEYTNDVSLNYDNFPRGVLNGGSRGFTFFENGNKYREVQNFLNNPGLFPKPPYPYYNIFKAGLRLAPIEKLELYLDYTRNPYEKAGQVDDNMNHIGLLAAYSPTPKIGLFFKYTYSRWQDLDSIVQNINKVYGHHNLFSELIYRKSNDEDFTFQFGEASRDPYMGGVLDIGWDPYGGSLRTIDTQHILRFYYRRKF